MYFIAGKCCNSSKPFIPGISISKKSKVSASSLIAFNASAPE